MPTLGQIGNREKCFMSYCSNLSSGTHETTAAHGLA
jgi:hypothetical protein